MISSAKISAIVLIVLIERSLTPLAIKWIAFTIAGNLYLVDPAQWGHVHGLLSHDTTGTEFGEVFTRTAILDGSNR
jgi:hypothetical protein